MPWSEQAVSLPAMLAAGFVAALALSALGSRWAIVHAHRNDLLDQPGERRSHAVPTPRGGGIGIVIACSLALLAIGVGATRPGSWLLVAAGLLLHFGNAWALLPLLWLPWGAYASRQRARREGYAVDERLVAVRSGWWSRWWRFAEIDKLQALRLERSPIDRRFGTATLRLDTAGAGSLAPPLRLRFLPELEAEALYRQLGRKLARQRLRW